MIFSISCTLMCGAVPCLWAQPEPVCAVPEMWAHHPMEGAGRHAVLSSVKSPVSSEWVAARLQNVCIMHIFSFTDGACTSCWRPTGTRSSRTRSRRSRPGSLCTLYTPASMKIFCPFYATRSASSSLSTWSGTFLPSRRCSLRCVSSLRWVWRSEGGRSLPCSWHRVSFGFGFFNNQIKSKTQMDRNETDKNDRNEPIKMIEINR